MLSCTKPSIYSKTLFPLFYHFIFIISIVIIIIIISLLSFLMQIDIKTKANCDFKSAYFCYY